MLQGRLRRELRRPQKAVRARPGPSTFGAYGGLTCVLAESLTRDAVFDAITLTPPPCAAGAICTGFA